VIGRYSIAQRLGAAPLSAQQVTRTSVEKRSQDCAVDMDRWWRSQRQGKYSPVAVADVIGSSYGSQYQYAVAAIVLADVAAEPRIDVASRRLLDTPRTQNRFAPSGLSVDSSPRSQPVEGQPARSPGQGMGQVHRCLRWPLMAMADGSSSHALTANPTSVVPKTDSAAVVEQQGFAPSWIIAGRDLMCCCRKPGWREGALVLMSVGLSLLASGQRCSSSWALAEEEVVGSVPRGAVGTLSSPQSGRLQSRRLEEVAADDRRGWSSG